MSAPNPEAAIAWMAKCQSDLRATDALMDADPPILDLACYHACQAAEKALKALIAAYDQPPERTHDLLRLCDLVSVEVPSEVVRWCEEILPYSWSTRYPTDLEVTISLALSAQVAARGIAQWVVGLVAVP